LQQNGAQRTDAPYLPSNCSNAFLFSRPYRREGAPEIKPWLNI
jgi:hypothetical protein